MANSILIHPTSEAKFEAIKAFLTAFDVKFETKKNYFDASEELDTNMKSFVQERLDVYLNKPENTTDWDTFYNSIKKK